MQIDVKGLVPVMSTKRRTSAPRAAGATRKELHAVENGTRKGGGVRVMVLVCSYMVHAGTRTYAAVRLHVWLSFGVLGKKHVT